MHSFDCGLSWVLKLSNLRIFVSAWGRYEEDNQASLTDRRAEWRALDEI